MFTKSGSSTIILILLCILIFGFAESAHAQQPPLCRNYDPGAASRFFGTWQWKNPASGDKVTIKDAKTNAIADFYDGSGYQGPYYTCDGKLVGPILNISDPIPNDPRYKSYHWSEFEILSNGNLNYRDVTWTAIRGLFCHNCPYDNEIVKVNRPCPQGIGPDGKTAEQSMGIDPKVMTQAQRQWLFEAFGHTGIAPVGYGGEACMPNSSTPTSAISTRVPNTPTRTSSNSSTQTPPNVASNNAPLCSELGYNPGLIPQVRAEDFGCTTYVYELPQMKFLRDCWHHGYPVAREWADRARGIGTSADSKDCKDLTVNPKAKGQTLDLKDIWTGDIVVFESDKTNCGYAYENGHVAYVTASHSENGTIDVDEANVPLGSPKRHNAGVKVEDCMSFIHVQGSTSYPSSNTTQRDSKQQPQDIWSSIAQTIADFLRSIFR